jgi:hypothetical protein
MLGLGSPRVRSKPVRPAADVPPEAAARRTDPAEPTPRRLDPAEPTPRRTTPPEVQGPAVQPVSPAPDRPRSPIRSERPGRREQDSARDAEVQAGFDEEEWPSDGEKTGTVRVIRSPVKRPDPDPPAPLF